ncbi:bifunctional DNA-binding transcriptional regulator/O6-methylguanine-DNA methyltransferase Ada [Stutzerimonas sp. Brlt_13]|uniref:bifunctional DNA-binding transcriptional regulator/O6-methylguanine-DNA methyltransferase Ada n=1 Tax=Stutzerimonas TaxID=2901164 RepID=UPI000F7B50D8|nr:bifunctional DNA-binding transcriptional regulator/O6-methylguanine-DNA methyltransferase Ada [Stutzerimonas stutzeri]MBH3352498.1 bifunctional DNA-binding transcriptional regulator/O6-methylguanine-DNA methyltransferase Ada [Stutzerimonas stutzeri]MDH1539312.1 bifunctional DNA-binding transcriptional regulator/O6-methylguanine-DNA methyltransferase Ada [Stutzerimonas stutzeri]RRV67043.1 bifunctional DNA-binding transcriptional regulator/O6-methylguanine-DNA methyltransferase Ada [Stutzerimon
MLDEDRCWQALCERDAAFDGRFVFAVRSTGIFCRPSCPARRPARERVAFFADGEAARAAGFRPCRRCSPMGPSPSEQLDALVVAACRLLDEATGPMTLPQLAARIGLSPTHLARAFKARTGLTPHAWATARRRERLDAQLPEAGSVLDAALAVGYSGTRAPYAEARALTPAQRRRKGAGETLRYALAPCPLGLLLLAASDKGICALLFGDDEGALEQELRSRFAAADLRRDQAGLGDWLQAIVSQLEEPQRATQLPLDLRGTAFQQRVWQALQQIPAGETLRYGELAATLGSHARAVARACASNPIGLLVPCHRVVGSQNALTGYRWGLARKARLLDREGQGESGA